MGDLDVLSYSVGSETIMMLILRLFSCMAYIKICVYCVTIIEQNDIIEGSLRRSAHYFHLWVGVLALVSHVVTITIPRRCLPCYSNVRTFKPSYLHCKNNNETILYLDTGWQKKHMDADISLIVPIVYHTHFNSVLHAVFFSNTSHKHPMAQLEGQNLIYR